MAMSVVTTVVTPAASYDLVDLEELKEDLQITSTMDDGYLERLITRASAAAAQYCNRVFAVETVADQFVAPRHLGGVPVGSGRERLQLSRWPLVAVTSVVLTHGDGTTETLDPATDFLANPRLGQLTRLAAGGSSGWWPPGGIAVTYSAGFGAVPGDIADAVTRLVKARYAARTRDPLLRSENIPGVSSNTYWVATSDGGNLPPDVKDALDNYRVPVIA